MILGETPIQEYGEVVCVMGSSANYSNIEVFLQANASMAIEPRYPQLCQSVPVSLPPKVGPSPVATSQLLNSVASSLSFKVWRICSYSQIKGDEKTIQHRWTTASPSST